MKKYDEDNPVLSFRVTRSVLEKFDKFIKNRGDSRQEYLKKLFLEDMRKKEVVRVIYE